MSKDRWVFLAMPFAVAAGMAFDSNCVGVGFAFCFNTGLCILESMT